MVVAGTVEIVGSIDIESVKHGLNQLKQGLDEARNASRSAFGDLKRMGETISGIATPLAKIGATLGTTILGIAAISPAIAPSLARMQADFLRLSRILGEELKPVFEALEVAFEGFVQFLDSEEGRGVIERFGTAITGLINLTTLEIDKLNELTGIEKLDIIGLGAAAAGAGAGILGAGAAAPSIGLAAGGGIAGFFGAQALLGEGAPLNFLLGPAKAGLLGGPDAGIAALVEQFFDREAITNQLMKLWNISDTG